MEQLILKSKLSVVGKKTEDIIKLEGLHIWIKENHVFTPHGIKK